ncbi:MAG: LD-carboxypeptidase [Alphaproteobacteria bacterium]|nr:LD-carboxypeptidase [Alphaproteobacteria bacterium]
MIAPGAPIAVVAPCGAYDPTRFAEGLRIAREHGLNPVPLPGNLHPWRYFAGTDAHRLEQLVEALTSDAYAAVWIARGGYGLTRILDGIPWERVQSRPVIGFSDVTALFNAMYLRGIGTPVHGPVVHSLPVSDATTVERLVAVLAGERPALEGEVWVPGRAEGRVVGGNLCLLAATAGTSAQLDASGCILVLEEIGEQAYRVDRMLQQLHSAGIFDGVQAVVLGEFVSCRAPDGADWTLDDMLRDHLEPLGVPVLAGCPVGHGARNHAFVWGSQGVVDGRLAFL